jgi:hypothetical protein
MSDSRAAAGFDRLPWLPDEPIRRDIRQPKRRSRGMAGWAVASMLIVAAASFWFGSRTQDDHVPPAPVQVAHHAPAPAARVSHPVQQREVHFAPQPEVAPARPPEVRPSPAPQVRIAPPPERKVSTDQVVKQVASEAPVERQQAAAAKAAPEAPLVPWPSRVTAGAYGRLVQIGAYGSTVQAKRGWVAMVKAYPAVAHLSAVVVQSRNSHGRLFYRFQIGTTSQAHSEVLCQRMEKIDLSCAIIGLPWKAKVER